MEASRLVITWQTPCPRAIEEGGLESVSLPEAGVVSAWRSTSPAENVPAPSFFQHTVALAPKLVQGTNKQAARRNGRIGLFYHAASVILTP